MSRCRAVDDPLSTHARDAAPRRSDGAKMKLDCASKLVVEPLQGSFASPRPLPYSAGEPDIHHHRPSNYQPANSFSRKHRPRQLVLQHIRSACVTRLSNLRRGTGEPRRFASQRGVDCAQGRCQCLSFSITITLHPFDSRPRIPDQAPCIHSRLVSFRG